METVILNPEWYCYIYRSDYDSWGIDEIMTPEPTLHPGVYKLNTWLRNPEGRPRERDWRLKETWEPGMKFHCFEVYFDGHTVPAIYEGQHPGNHVHAHCMPTVFAALVDHLERI